MCVRNFMTHGVPKYVLLKCIMVNQTDPACRDSGLFSTKKVTSFVKFVEINCIIISFCVCFLWVRPFFIHADYLSPNQAECTVSPVCAGQCMSHSLFSVSSHHSVHWSWPSALSLAAPTPLPSVALISFLLADSLCCDPLGKPLSPKTSTL